MANNDTTRMLSTMSTVTETFLATIEQLKDTVSILNSSLEESRKANKRLRTRLASLDRKVDKLDDRISNAENTIDNGVASNLVSIAYDEDYVDDEEEELGMPASPKTPAARVKAVEDNVVYLNIGRKGKK